MRYDAGADIVAGELKTTAEERARLRANFLGAGKFTLSIADVPRVLDDLDTLLAENARLQEVAEAAREYRAMEAPGLDMCRDVARDDLDAALAASGPDPMPVVRAACEYLDHGDDGRLGQAWVGFREAVDAYRKAGGK